MATSPTLKNTPLVVSPIDARTNLGKLLTRVDTERRSLIIEKHGTPRAILLSIHDYVRLAAPEPEVLKIIGQESERNQTSSLSSRQIDQLIRTTRAQKKKKK